MKCTWLNIKGDQVITIPQGYGLARLRAKEGKLVLAKDYCGRIVRVKDFTNK